GTGRYRGTAGTAVLQPVPEGPLAVGRPGPVTGGTGGVAGEHRPAAPAGQAHEVLALAAVGQPAVGEGVAQLVGVDVAEARLGSPAPHHLADAVGGQRALRPEPQL